MKKNYLLVVLLMACGWVTAQSTLTITPNPVDITGDVMDGIIKGSMDLSHSGAAPLTMAWERLTNDIPAGWSTSICDPNLCYGPASDQPLDGTGTLTPFAMPAMGTVPGSQFYVQFVSGGNIGDGTVRLRAYDVNDTTNAVIATVTLTVTEDATAIAEVNIENEISIYPNPVSSMMQIASASANVNIKTIEIYNIVGKQVKVIELQNVERLISIDLAELKEGMYFARVLDNNNQLLSSKRITKVN